MCYEGPPGEVAGGGGRARGTVGPVLLCFWWEGRSEAETLFRMGRFESLQGAQGVGAAPRGLRPGSVITGPRNKHPTD